MSTTAVSPVPMVAQFLQTFASEHKTTMKVLKAVPADKLDFKPHERNMSAGELAWHIAGSQLYIAKALASGSFSGPPPAAIPSTLDEIVAGCESFYEQTCKVLSGLTQEQLQGAVSLPNGLSFPIAPFMWSGVLFHQIHHRGQLSIYIRMMGGKVPSIYGPSGDENPFA